MNKTLEEGLKELIELYIAPNQRSQVEQCVLGKAEHKGTIRINSSAIPLFRAIKDFAEKIRESVVGEVRGITNLYGEPRCENLHHSRKNQHSGIEECPVEKEINDLLAKLKDK